MRHAPGAPRSRQRQPRALPFDPASIDAVVISHAHLDHSGLLPRLAAEGFKGAIFATEATCELLELMLLDSAHIQEKDAEWENRWRNRIGKPSIKPLYTQADTERAPSCAGRSASAAPWRSLVACG